MGQQTLALPLPGGPPAHPEQFDWRADDSIVSGHQPATAIYRNACNAVVIRQEGDLGENDHFVILRDAEAVQIVVEALKAEVEGARL